jgi:FkbM family methyltransferase
MRAHGHGCDGDAGMIAALKPTCLRAAQTVIVWAIRPYIFRELPGWGKLYAIFADYRRDWLWAGAPVKTMREKLDGRLMQVDLSKWSDRSTYLLGRWTDLHIQLLLRDLITPGDTVVDVGANRGLFAFTARHLVGDSGQVICFEPNPDCAAILEQEVAANGVTNLTVHHFGLGDRDEELTLSVPAINSGEGTFGRTAYEQSSCHEVRAWTKIGDPLLRSESPSLIKIDVEGFECKVIAGLAQTIRQHRPIILTEVAPSLLATSGSSAVELTDLLGGFGYRGFELGLRKDGWRYDWQMTPLSNKLTTVDAVWVPGELTNGRHAAIFKKHSS